MFHMDDPSLLGMKRDTERLENLGGNPQRGLCF